MNKQTQTKAIRTLPSLSNNNNVEVPQKKKRVKRSNTYYAGVVPLDMIVEVLKLVPLTKHLFWSLCLTSKLIRSLALKFCNLQTIQKDLMIAIFNQDLEFVFGEIISNPTFDFSNDWDYIMKYSVQKGRTDVVDRLLGAPALSKDSDEILRLACEKGQLSIVKKFLKDHRFHPGNRDNWAFTYACKFGHLEVAMTLLEDCRVTPNNQALSEAADNGQLHIVRMLLNLLGINVRAIGNQALCRACQNGHLEIVEELLNDSRVDPAENKLETLFRASYRGHKAIVDRLLKETRIQKCIDRNYLAQTVDKNENNNRVLQAACEMGHVDIASMLLADHRFGVDWKAVFSVCYSGHLTILEMLLKDPRIAIDLDSRLLVLNQGYNDAVGVACENGHLDIVKCLLDKYVALNPFKNVESGMSRASMKGHLNVVEFLSKDKRCTSIHVTEALFSACYKGHLTIVEFLLGNMNANPSLRTSRKTPENCLLPLEAACVSGSTEVVKRLLQDKRTNPSIDRNYCIIIASKKGYADVVQVLLQDERVDPTVNNNEPLLRSCENGHLEVVKVLLGDKRVAEEPYYAFLAASRGGKHEIVQLLLLDPRFDPCKNNMEGLRVAILGKHTKTYKLLLKDARVNPKNVKIAIPKLRQDCKNGVCLRTTLQIPVP